MFKKILQSRFGGGITSGDRTVSIPQVIFRALRIARGFDSLGVGEGDRVAVLMRNDLVNFEVTFATVLLGAYTVPVNWHYQAAEARFVIEDSGAKVIVIHADLLARLGDGLPADLTVLVVPIPPEIVAAYDLDPADCAVPAGATEWNDWVAGFWPRIARRKPRRGSMFYTSGTTGRPKGVRRQPLSGAGAEEAAAKMFADVMGIDRDMRAILTGPLYHSAPSSYAIQAFLARGTVFMQPRFDPEDLLRMIETHRASHVIMVPTMFVRLLRLPQAVREKYDVSSLKWVIHGAAPCPLHVKQAMIDWWGPVLYEYYGSTEAGLISCASSAEWLDRPGTVGLPVETATVRILGDNGGVLDSGEVGEIYMLVGAVPDFTYHNMDDERIAVEQDGLITNGDIGYMDDDGYLYLCDRKIDMVISGGVNIYPAEIEATLMGMEGVRDCAVFGIPDEEMGEALAAYIEPDEGTELTGDQVKSWLREHQAGYKTPRVIEFRGELPRLDSGKMLKRELRQPYWEKAGRNI